MVNQIANYQNGKANDIQSDSLWVGRLPLVYIVIVSNSNRYYDACQPYDSGADDIANCSCQSIYVVCDGNSADVEPKDCKYLQDSH